MAEKNVTNQEIYDMLHVMGYGADILGEGGFDLSGAQNSQFKTRLKSVGITDKDFDNAKQMARIGNPKNGKELSDFLHAAGLKDQAISDVFKEGGMPLGPLGAAGVDVLSPKLYEAIGTKFGDTMRQYLSTDRMPGQPFSDARTPVAPVAPVPAPAPATPAAPRGQIKGDTGLVAPVKTAPVDPMQAWMEGKGPAPAKATDQDVQAYIRKNYPGEIAGLMDIPDIWNVVKTAAKDGRPAGWVTGQVETTKYWQTHDLAARQWDEQAQTDPETQRVKVQKESDDIAQWAGKYGVNLTPERLKDLATQSVIHGWKPEDKHRVLSSEFHYSPGPSADPQVVSDLKKKAGDYYVPLSEKAINEWGQHIMAADGDMSGFDGYLVQQAKSLFPTLSAALDRGVSVKTFADPYAQIASKILEIPQSDVDFSNPKFMQALVHTDPKTNDRTFMNMFDWQEELKSNPVYKWDQTSNARDDATALSQKIIQRFGGGV